MPLSQGQLFWPTGTFFLLWGLYYYAKSISHKNNKQLWIALLLLFIGILCFGAALEILIR